MKTSLLTLGTSLLFTISAVVTVSYAGSDNYAGQAMDTQQGQHDGGHMGHMNTVLQNLKDELGDRYDQPVPPASKEQLVLGKQVFSQSCVACHGENGQGDGPAAVAFKKKPADFTDATHSKFYSDQARIQIIKKGIPNTGMAGWEGRLKDQEIHSVYIYIRSLRNTEMNKDEAHGSHGHGH